MLKQAPSTQESSTRSPESNPQSYWKQIDTCLHLLRHPDSERWRSWWVLLNCVWSGKKLKTSERTSAQILCLQNPSTKGHGLLEAKMNEISFFLYILAFEWGPIRAGAEWTAQITITLKKELIFGSAFRNVGQSLMYRWRSLMLNNNLHYEFIDFFNVCSINALKW